jgi:apolipoprotein N-acyltransferase
VTPSASSKTAPLFARLGPIALAVIAGLAAGFAQPPWGVLPGLLGYGVMFRLVDAARGPGRLRAAFFRGWLTGCAYFAVSVWWISAPFRVDAQNQGWMGPLAVPVVAMFMALFWGAAAGLYRALAGPGVLRAIGFAASLAGFEWLRGHILTGFPWDLPGESWAAGSPLSQTAAFVGAYGLTWITLAGAAGVMVVAEGRAGLSLALSAVAILAGLWGLGFERLGHAPRALPGTPIVRIVQPDVQQSSKYDPAMFADIVSRYVGLTARPAAGPAPNVIIWPEGAIPAAFEDYLAPGTWTRDAIAKALGPRQTLILGGYRFARDAQGKDVTFNSLAGLRTVDGELSVQAVYDKYRLVPFGEYMPLDGLAGRLGFKQMVHVGDGFSPGTKPRPMALLGLPTFQPLICYEALYPGFTRAGTLASGLRPSWIVNISNDAWFGVGSGPLQHFNMASYRAIEEGLPMARATPTGVSAIIDAMGRAQPGKRLGIGAFGVIDGPLPGALPPTLYDRLGDGLFFLALALSLVGCAWPRFTGRRA